MTTRREFLSYTGAGVGVLAAGRYLTACDPPDTETISGEQTSGPFTIEPGEVLQFDPDADTTLTVTGNVIVKGTLRMRPNPGVTHILRFTGINEANFVGGHTSTPLASDVGLWVLDAGKLDAVGSPKQGWNRTGDDSTWLSSDELVVAPNAAVAPAVDPAPFASFTKGGAVPQFTHDGVTYKTEVANLTRNVRIEGTATGKSHVMFLHSTVPQTIKHVQLRYMTPQKLVGTTKEAVQGRYALHFHLCHDGSRGSVVEGCVIRDTGGPAYVSHLSNGIHYTDCVAYRTTDKAYWWDDETSTDDISYTHCAGFGVRPKPKGNGFDALSVNAFDLAEGTNISAVDCVAAGCGGVNVHAGGFHWPEGGGGVDEWLFQDCVAHNNRPGGISVWQNDNTALHDNIVDRFVCYRNGLGISAGAYKNNYTYRDGVCFGNIYEVGSQKSADLEHRAASGAFEGCRFDKVRIGHHQTIGNPGTTFYRDCTIGTVIVDEPGGAINVEFHSTSPAHDLSPSDFQVIQVRSQITVHNSDGSSFTVT